MSDKRKKLVLSKTNEFSLFKRLFVILVLLLLILSFSIISYLLYTNVFGKVENYSVVSKPSIRLEPPTEPKINKTEANKKEINKTETEIVSEVQQFFLNTKFNHNLISYRIDSECDLNKRNRIIAAFSIIATNVLPLNFYEVSDIPDIEVSCSEEDKSTTEKDYFIAGEGGAKEIIQTGEYNIITNGTILLYKTPENSISCDWPNIELHELMHVFGFNHSESKQSLMYPTIANCDQQLDESITNLLIELYSEENLPDLHFKNVTAKKNGKYLDFNLTIKNSGLIEAKKVGFSIFDDDKFVQTVELSDINNFDGNLNYGYEVTLQVINFRLISSDSTEIKFVIDKDNLIKELNENNNIIRIKPE